MSSLFGIAAGGSGEFYDFKINQSLRFNEASQAYLRKTNFSGSPTSDQTGTFSVWVKNTLSYSDNRNAIYGSATGSAAFISLSLAGDSQVLDLRRRNTNSSDVIDVIGNPAQRDPSAWYHIMSVYDMTNATQADRAQIYVNGVRVTDLGTNTLPSNTTTEYYSGDFISDMQIGRTNTNGSNMLYADFILAEYHRVDGQALSPTSFGETKSGVWIPKEYTGSYGNHGFYLDFADTSDIGKDVSGNSNDFTANNLSAHDVMPDSPTLNYSTWNSIDSNTSLSEGNLKFAQGSGAGYKANSTFIIEDIADSQKYYVEYVTDSGYVNGIIPADVTGANNNATRTGHLGYYPNTGLKYNGATTSSYGATHGTSNQMAMLIGDGQIEFFKDNASQGVAFSSLTGSYKVCSGAFGAAGAGVIMNFGADSSFAGAKTSGSANASDANGIGDFFYAPPSGALALSASNLPEPSITPLNDDIPEDYFETNIWTGNGSSQSISSYEFAPDWIWIKERNSTSSHYVVDRVRGLNATIQTNSTTDEFSNTVNVTSFDSNGFSLGNGGTTNENNKTYVGWAWLAGGSASSNSAGDIDSSVSANTEAGFSIVGYTGDGTSATRTIGCGLTKKPEMVILKNRTDDSVSDTWFVWHQAFGTASPSKYMTLYNTDAVSASGVFVDSSFSDNSGNALFAVDGSYNGVNKSGTTYIAYCFNSIEGYSKLGSYTGNGSADGTFVYTGFRPAWVMVKRTDSTASWQILDSKRNTFNDADDCLFPDTNGVEATTTSNNEDFLSNGFKCRGSGNRSNASGSTYLYMAFAEMPFKYANAR